MTTVQTTTSKDGCCGGTEECGCQPAPILDMSGVMIADLLSGDAPPGLRQSTERLVRGLNDPNGVISAFGSFVGPE